MGASIANAFGMASAEAAGTSLINLPGVLINQDFQRSQAGDARVFSHEEAQYSRDFTKSEREASQQFYQDMADQNYLHQMNLNQQQFNRQQQLLAEERAYNSAPEQAKRLRAAGFNPAVYFGGSSSVVGTSTPSPASSSSPAGVSAPSGASPSIPSTPVGGSSQIPAVNFDLAGTIEKLANAGKTISETKSIDLMRNPQYKDLMTRIAGQELANASLKLSNMFDSLSLPKRLEKLGNEVASLAMQTLLAESEKDKNVSQTSLNHAYERLQDALRDKTDTEYLILKNELAHWKQSYDNKLKNDAAERAKNYGIADEAHSQARINDVVQKIKSVEFNFTESMLHNQLEGLKRDNMLKDWQIDCAKSAAEIARVNASHAEALFWKDFISDIISQGFNAFLGYKNASSWSRLSEASQQNAERKIEEMKWKYGDTMEDTYKKTDSSGFVHQYKVTRRTDGNKFHYKK